MSVSFVYITASSVEEAEIIGRNLVSRKLAACVNIIEGMKSIYHWEGKIETGEEVVLIAKTKQALIDELTENVKALHSYKCPCVVALQVIGGNPDFLRWVVNETK
ncbi:MAG TPA: divalent-cation tolerance protein CutA [Spirochaetota bacterium]|nr:divalent-cation tolerance protein CutA [Spirochaetota bacterium]HQO39282.1 divalent-cation tolerance protein CutA [Spirochaetota bacterium]